MNARMRNIKNFPSHWQHKTSQKKENFRRALRTTERSRKNLNLVPKVSTKSQIIEKSKKYFDGRNRYFMQKSSLGGRTNLKDVKQMKFWD